MSVLVTDIALCKGELCRILFAPLIEWSVQVRVANITQAGSSLNHHTEYQLIITAVPRNSLQLDSKQFILWTRFKNLSRLWSQLSKIHQQLYLHGSFPSFAPPKLFGNAEPGVIAERIEATSRFLNFVFANDVLRKAKVLLQFFEEASEILDDSNEQPSSAALNPQREPPAEPLVNLLDDEGEAGAPTASVDEPTKRSQSDATPIPHSADSLDEMANPTSPAGTSNSASLSFGVRTLGSNRSSSSSCFLFDFPDVALQGAGTSSTVADTATADLPTPHPAVPATPSDSAPTSTQSPPNRYLSIIERILPKVMTSTGRDTPRSALDVSTSSALPSVRSDSSFFSLIGPTLPDPLQRSSSNVRMGVRSLTSTPATSTPSLSVPSGDSRNDYLFNAAQFISAAQKAESERAFELAFHCYKSAVNALLQGVQFERDLSRRNAVRKKTAKYLLKAEKLYRLYLAFDGSSFDVDSWLSNSIYDPSLIAFQSSSASLKSYRIIKILPSPRARKRVFLVEDRSSAGNGARYVMKLLEKSSSVKQSARVAPLCTVVPTNVSNMVRLHKFFDLDNFIVLLLEYIECGTLWDFLADYFEEGSRQVGAYSEGGSCETYPRDPSTSRTLSRTAAPEASSLPTETDANAEGESASEDLQKSDAARCRRNAYEGKHVRFSVGCEEDDDEATDLSVFSAFDQIISKSTNKSWSPGRESMDSTECFGSAQSSSRPESGGTREERSMDGGEGETGVGEENASFASGFRSVLQDTMSASTADYFSVVDDVDEEAPAPILLDAEVRASRSVSTTSQPHGEEVTLADAKAEVKKRLKKGRRWKRSKRLPESLVAHWMAQLVSAVYLLHFQGIIVRDIRPDNLLIDEEGDLKLTYCSQWNNVDFRDDEVAIADGYAAPELCLVTQTVTEAADRWSIGAILFELLCACKMKNLCLHGLSNALELPIPDCVDVSFAARDLLSRLLVVNPVQRLTDDELRGHPFFSACNWAVYDGSAAISPTRRLSQNKVGFAKSESAGPSSSYGIPKSFVESLSSQRVVMVVGDGDDTAPTSGEW